MNEKMFSAWDTIYEATKDLDGKSFLVIACMMLDVAGVKNDMTTEEVLDFVRPAVKDVNDQCGTMVL